MESEWTANVDASVTYAPNTDALPGAMTFRFDVFNLLNDDGVTDLFERGDDLGGSLDNYGTASAYYAPRKVRLSFNWKF